jgi:hypothetical protein
MPFATEAKQPTSQALVVINPTEQKSKRRSSWQILIDMWDGMWLWGSMSDESRRKLSIEQFGYTKVDGARRSQRIASKVAQRNLIKET